jgi:ankyrin repeat protein
MGARHTLPLAAVLMLAVVTVSSSTPTLVDAVQSGNRDAVRALLRAKVNVNASEADGTTPLHYAVRADDLETTKLLLKAGANAKVANRYGSSPLSLAAINGNAAIVALLLDAGADPNSVVSKGQTVLMTAARTGNREVVTLLLDRGAHVAATEDTLGENALMWAASENHADVVALLLQRGADANATSTALTFPKPSFGLEGVLTILPRGAWPPLMYAARDGAPDAARVLADGGAELNYQDAEGTTALVRAIQNSHYDAAAVLIEKGADPNLADTSGMAALYTAVDMNSLGEIYGRPPRRVNDRHTALDVIALLLDHKADPNAQLKGPTLTRAHTPGDSTLGAGTTPLMRAAMHGDYQAMNVLLAHGADVKTASRNGATAIMFAAGLGRGTSAFAEDVGTEPEMLKAVQVTIDHGADVKAANTQGGTPLHFAAQSGFDSVITLLAAKGAVLDAKDKQGRTPADLARGVGVRGRAGGPAVLHPSSAALLDKLIASPGGRL